MKNKFFIPVLGGLVVTGGIFAALTINSDSASAELSKEEALEKVQTTFPGEVVEWELEREGNRKVYEIEIKGSDRHYELEIDADTEEVLKVEEEVFSNKKVSKADTSSNQSGEYDSEANKKKDSILSVSEVEKIAQDLIEGKIEELELDEILDDLFHKKISQDTEELYRLSVAVTKSMMTNLFDPDEEVYYEMHGMLYPSIEREGKGFNFIFKPAHAKLHFGVSQLVTFKVIESNTKIIIVEEVRKALQKPTLRMDPFDYYGFKWENITSPKILKFSV